MTTRSIPRNLRVWWDDQEHPSIECPVADFFGIAHGIVKPYGSAVHSVGEKAGMNIWLPMAFAKRARFEFVNECEKDIPLTHGVVCAHSFFRDKKSNRPAAGE